MLVATIQVHRAISCEQIEFRRGRCSKSPPIVSEIMLKHSDGSGAGHRNPLTSFCLILILLSHTRRLFSCDRCTSRLSGPFIIDKTLTSLVSAFGSFPAKPRFPRQASVCLSRTTTRIDRESSQNEHSKQNWAVCEGLTIEENGVFGVSVLPFAHPYGLAFSIVGKGGKVEGENSAAGDLGPKTGQKACCDAPSSYCRTNVCYDAPSS
jgi:hypothetical protein